jgi:hypothetical protein
MEKKSKTKRNEQKYQRPRNETKRKKTTGFEIQTKRKKIRNDTKRKKKNQGPRNETEKIEKRKKLRFSNPEKYL